MESSQAAGLDKLSKTIEQHDTALEALKDIPSLLEQVARKVGIVPKKKGEWSLGLSDEEDENDYTNPEIDANKIIDMDKDDDTNEMSELLADVEKVVEFGPTLLPSVSLGFAKTVSRPLTKETKAVLKDKIRIPENCKEFAVPKVNPEIWRLLPTTAKLTDIKQQQLQSTISVTLSSLASIANNMASNKEKIPKEVMSTVVKQALDSANLLGDEFQTINSRRRYDMKRFLNPEFAGICSNEFPSSEWLFGTNLEERLKTSKATATLMKNTAARNGRFHPYTGSRPVRPTSQPTLNYYRPSPYQSRGSGHFQPRFQRRSQGQASFRMPSQDNQWQQKYRRQ